MFRGIMKIPILYYFYFWAINSLLATGTGFVIGIFAIRLLILLLMANTSIYTTEFVEFMLNPMVSSIIFFVIYQLVFVSFFWGTRRGEFEYSYIENVAKRGKSDNWLKIYLKDIKQELKYAGISSAHSKLESLVTKYPDNFLTQFKYAISCERMGLTQDAIATYKTAMNLQSIKSENLKYYANRQIERIKQKGPSKKSSAPGLQYVMY